MGFDLNMAHESEVPSPFSDPEERRVLFAALDSFRQYRKIAHYNVTHRRRQNFYALPTSQWQMLAAPPFNLLSVFDHVDDAIDANAEIASEMMNTALLSFGVDDLKSTTGLETPASSSFGSADENEAQRLIDWRNTAKPSDIDKARSTIRQLYRDWSHEGAAERKACYEPVIQDVVRAFWHSPSKHDVKILVPGAGLGRLVFELCRRGYTVEGNEISYHQLIASNWVLNHTVKGQQFDLYPFALDFSNVVSREHQLKKVKVPDVHPGSALEDDFGHTTANAADRMSMTAADFVVLYGDEEHKDMFNAVVTVFFIDTAPNLIRYIETIRNCLQDGGLWINLGPLLWHFADRAPSEECHSKRAEGPREKTGIEEPGAFELTDEEVLTLVEKMGFDIEKREIRNGGVGYIQNPESMLQNVYRTSHWIAKKRPRI
ncbi:hypothetical protein HO173_008886 [Letharia columbiana]|uniref:carnosine N-methyltransferase n=1 Tax=Letharia columbiana TaxID=112416 RepID=A0A8H6FQL5_9LECA|nr:uncharacterized protein HO173_008886 [Letharia columbiana]KAF6232923.1 hypothetical protein HO173_008886 [Letharia columbiana]